MNWVQKRRKAAGQGEQRAARRQKVDHRRWLEARVEGEVVKSESIVVEMGCGVRMLVANVGQAALGPRFCERWDWAGDWRRDRPNCSF